MKTLIETFDAQFNLLHYNLTNFVDMLPQDKLFWKPDLMKDYFTIYSCGEFILRSAAMVEQTFGGITARLWDDPYEWTLPESRSTKEKITEYLNEVEQTRQKAFATFNSDEDLLKELPAPEKMRTIAELLLETAVRAEHFHGRALAILQMYNYASRSAQLPGYKSPSAKI